MHRQAAAAWDERTTGPAIWPARPTRVLVLARNLASSNPPSPPRRAQSWQAGVTKSKLVLVLLWRLQNLFVGYTKLPSRCCAPQQLLLRPWKMSIECPSPEGLGDHRMSSLRFVTCTQNVHVTSSISPLFRLSRTSCCPSNLPPQKKFQDTTRPCRVNVHITNPTLISVT